MLFVWVIDLVQMSVLEELVPIAMPNLSTQESETIGQPRRRPWPLGPHRCKAQVFVVGETQEELWFEKAVQM